ncbi:MFS transporter [Aestuariivirga litoralis]|uniref:MFS transporter n=1 Tax=Aestuariivirga litoralis TaxID=2650924 RepID=UPI0018C549E5|nr:MFS transporter [Aestuariivirga litoralis]MBG1232616.1 MFS transporter [Aestuariivirga litoralis]
MQNSYRWVIVAVGGLIGCIAMGALFALPVFITTMAEQSKWSHTGISAAMTIAFLSMAFGGFISGTLTDRLGPFKVVLSGSALLAVGLALASQAPSLPLFQLFYGVFAGVAASAIMAPLMATVAGWFDTRVALAVSLVSAGMGLAPATMTPLASWLITHHDWRVSMLTMAVIVGATMVPLSFFIRRPPVLEAMAQGAAPNAAAGPQMSIGDALKSPPFVILALTNFFCCATHSGPIIHTISYAMTCGIPLVLASTIYTVEGLAGMGGRLVFGLAGDKFGAKQVVAVGLLAQAILALCYAFVGQLPGFYVVAALFGFTYAGVMPLYSALARENFPVSMMGTIIGGISAAGGLGMALGPLAGGLIYDQFASYFWLYAGAAGMGLASFLTILAFRPMAKPQMPSAIVA